MTGFWPVFGLTYVAATLLISGGWHLLRFRSFRHLVRSHEIVPSPLVTATAALTPIAELSAGTAALLLAVAPTALAPARVLLTTTGVLGVVFVLYVRRLLRQPVRSVACGCSPLSSPVTPASLIPGGALAAVSVTALAATFVPSGPADAAARGPGLLAVLPPLWGVALAALVMLVPASMPPSVVDSRW